jgi:hypothetical protein
MTWALEVVNLPRRPRRKLDREKLETAVPPSAHPLLSRQNGVDFAKAAVTGMIVVPTTGTP